MRQEILLSNERSQRFTTILGETEVLIEMTWHPLDASWYLSIRDTQNALLRNARCTESGRLQLFTPTLNGTLVILGTGPINRHAWGKTHRLFFERTK